MNLRRVKMKLCSLLWEMRTYFSKLRESLSYTCQKQRWMLAYSHFLNVIKINIYIFKNQYFHVSSIFQRFILNLYLMWIFQVHLVLLSLYLQGCVSSFLTLIGYIKDQMNSGTSPDKMHWRQKKVKHYSFSDSQKHSKIFSKNLLFSSQNIQIIKNKCWKFPKKSLYFRFFEI